VDQFQHNPPKLKNLDPTRTNTTHGKLGVVIARTCVLSRPASRRRRRRRRRFIFVRMPVWSCVHAPSPQCPDICPSGQSPPPRQTSLCPSLFCCRSTRVSVSNNIFYSFKRLSPKNGLCENNYLVIHNTKKRATNLNNGTDVTRLPNGILL